jgi:hypothetical protein
MLLGDPPEVFGCAVVVDADDGVSVHPFIVSVCYHAA